MKIVIIDKQVPVDELFYNFDNCTLPIDRISKFLSMLKRDLEHKKDCDYDDYGLSTLEQRYLTEIEFAQHKINQRAIYNSNMESIHRQQ